MIGAVFLHGDGSLERTVTNGEGHASSRRLLDGFAGFVARVACNDLPFNLEGGSE